jgi:hypothetical protein
MKIFKTANYIKIAKEQGCRGCGNLAVGHNGLCQKCQEEEEGIKERMDSSKYE